MTEVEVPRRFNYSLQTPTAFALLFSSVICNCVPVQRYSCTARLDQYGRAEFNSPASCGML